MWSSWLCRFSLSWKKSLAVVTKTVMAFLPIWLEALIPGSCPLSFHYTYSVFFSGSYLCSGRNGCHVIALVFVVSSLIGWGPRGHWPHGNHCSVLPTYMYFGPFLSCEGLLLERLSTTSVLVLYFQLTLVIPFTPTSLSTAYCPPGPVFCLLTLKA